MRFLGDVGRALAQLGDPSFRRVLLLGVGLTVVLLVAFYAVTLWLLNRVLPDTMMLPLLGEVGWIDNVLSGASLIALLLASVFLMVPVASTFTSFFLDDVTDAVEARHYPHLGPAPQIPLAQSVADGLRFLGVLVPANLLAFALYLAFAPFAPAIFLAMNGYLLGREYFQLIAMRREGRDGARALRRRHGLRIWAAGCVMAAPLAVPIVNLLVPVVGAAAFTHLYHRLPGRSVRDGSPSRSRRR